MRYIGIYFSVGVLVGLRRTGTRWVENLLHNNSYAHIHL